MRTQGIALGMGTHSCVWNTWKYMNGQCESSDIVKEGRSDSMRHNICPHLQAVRFRRRASHVCHTACLRASNTETVTRTRRWASAACGAVRHGAALDSAFDPLTYKI